MIKKRVTSKMVAKKAGVSQTTVSFVLNKVEGQNISPETTGRVLKAARDLGYVPQAAAQSLAQGQSHHIGLVLLQPHYQVFQDPYIPNVMTGLGEIVRNQGFRLIVEHIDNLKDLHTIRNMLKSGEVAGLILANFHWAEEITAQLIQEEYPIVLLDATTNKKYPVVSINHVSGVTIAAQHILSMGHERIACITYAPDDHLHAEKRLNVLRNILEEGGITPDNLLVRHGQYDPDSAYKAMQSLLVTEPIPTVVFGMNDMMALGAMRAILDAGLRIPEDIAVIGYDDMRFTKFVNPSLTTVRAQEIEQGRLGAEMLLNIINDEPLDFRQIELEPELIIRETCGYNLKHS